MRCGGGGRNGDGNKGEATEEEGEEGERRKFGGIRGGVGR